MTIKELKSKLPERCYLSDIWKREEENYLRFSIYDCSSFSSFRSYYRCHLELDYSGKILAVKNEHDSKPDLSKSFKHLIGKKIDLNSFEWYFEKEVKDSPSNMIDDTQIVGRIDRGRCVLFTKKNAHRLQGLIRSNFRSNNDEMKPYKEYRYAKWFTAFLKKHRNKLKRFRITDGGGTKFNYTFKIKGIKVELELWQFFNYHLKAIVHRPRKPLILEGDAVLKYRELL